MFEKILYPTDFSEVSKKALDVIKQLKACGTQQVIILHVIDLRDARNFARHSRELNFDQIVQRMEENAKEEMKDIEKELKESGFDVQAKISKGIPLTDILSTEELENVSLIILGSHGKSCVEEMFLGSVSEKVIRKSKKPILVVRR